MYLPSVFREDRLDQLHRLIRAHSFGMLISHTGDELTASHLPFLLRDDPGTHGTLLGHMARANPQWESFSKDVEALAIFQGPHAYISPSWYETELSVPTWNYAVVHGYGVPRLIQDPQAVRDLLSATAAYYEASLPNPWSLERVPEEYVEKLSRAIVAFEIPLTRLEGKFKLSQNRSEPDRLGAIAGLRSQGDAGSVATADLMSRSDSL